MASNPRSPGTRKPGSVGVEASPAVSIMNDGGVVIGPDQVGKIVIRGKV
ncbi:MAG: hypothetical protein IH853_02065 [Bacteroidetes bacterium]|nr:hypothetical protein [Bacteroidota bacterium]